MKLGFTRAIRGIVYNVPVDNSQEWHFLRNGRVLIRFIQNRAAPYSPVIVPEIIEVWGAYDITPSHGPQDIFHIYADNSLHIETDLGEQLELKLEDGRRHLFRPRAPGRVGGGAATYRLPTARQPRSEFEQYRYRANAAAAHRGKTWENAELIEHIEFP